MPFSLTVNNQSQILHVNNVKILVHSITQINTSISKYKSERLAFAFFTLISPKSVQNQYTKGDPKNIFIFP